MVKIRNRKIIIGALAVVALVASVSQAVNTWTGADPNRPTDWFLVTNWDSGTGTPLSIPPLVPTALGYSYTLTGVSKTVDIFKRPVDPNADPNNPATVLLQAGAMGLWVGNGAGDNITMNVKSGATLTIGASGIESAYADSTSGFSIGNIDVYGTIDSSSANGIRLARRGDSKMTIYNGGTVLSTDRIELQGGNGTVDVRSGGYLKATNIRAGIYNGSLQGSRANTTTAVVDCNGIMDLFGGGNSEMAYDASSKAVVNLKDGAMRIGSSTSGAGIQFPMNLNASKAVVNVSGGRLSIAGSVTRPAGTLNAGIDRQFNITGGQVNIRTWGDLAGDLVQAGGIFSPATYIAATDSYNEVSRTDFGPINPVNYTQQTGATIQIDIAGTTQATGGNNSGQYDFINCTGAVSLAGPLKVVFRENYELYANNTGTFTVINAVGGVTGIFSNLVSGKVNAYNPAGNIQGQYVVTVGPNTVVLSNFTSSNMPPVVTLSNVYTYLAVAGSISITPTVTDVDDAVASTVWSVVNQPAGSNITILPSLASKNITVSVDTVGTYTLRLTATDAGGKIGLNSMTINVAADACAAAKIVPGYAKPAGDANGDCKVNMADFSLMAGNWLRCNDITCP